MKRHFFKGALRKELVYMKAENGELYRNQPHVISLYPSDKKGHILLECEKREEMPSRKRAEGVFWTWAKELIDVGWICEEMTSEQIARRHSSASQDADDARKKEYKVRDMSKVQDGTYWGGTTIKKTCAFCGKEFEGRAKNAKYCCPKHKEQARRASVKKAGAKWYEKHKEEKEIRRKVESIVKTNDVMSRYNSMSYVVNEFMKKAEDHNEVDYIANVIKNTLESASKEATIRIDIMERFPTKGVDAEAPKVVEPAKAKEK